MKTATLCLRTDLVGKQVPEILPQQVMGLLLFRTKAKNMGKCLMWTLCAYLDSPILPIEEGNVAK